MRTFLPPGYFTAAKPGEEDIYSVDFTDRINGIPGDGPQIGSQTVTISVVNGSDPNADNCLLGSPTISGNVVSQKAGGLLPGGFQPGVTYLLLFSVTTLAGDTYVYPGNVPCNQVA